MSGSSSPDRAALAHVAHVTRLVPGAPLPPGAQVHLQFHPDRGVVEGLLRDGAYRSQFETGTGNGGLTAHPGGDRWAWESRLFGGAYDDAPPSARPKYGALASSSKVRGAAPRFGSSFLRLRRETLARTTFCWPDSVFSPTLLGAAGHVTHLLEAAAAAPPGDPLDAYVEAHVHGPVAIATDVEALVLDPSFRGTAVERVARDLPCAVEWHPGFRLAADELARHPGYRGAEHVALGLELARDGVLTPRLLGAAAPFTDPTALKRVWHLLARFG